MKLKKAVFLLAAGILLFCASLPAYAEEAQSKGLESYFRTGDHKPDVYKRQGGDYTEFSGLAGKKPV